MIFFARPRILLVLHANNIQNLNEFSHMEPSHAVRDSPKRGGEIAVVCLELDLTHFPPLPRPSPPLLMHANKSGTAWRDRQGLTVCSHLSNRTHQRVGNKDGHCLARVAAICGISNPGNIQNFRAK